MSFKFCAIAALPVSMYPGSDHPWRVRIGTTATTVFKDNVQVIDISGVPYRIEWRNNCVFVSCDKFSSCVTPTMNMTLCGQRIVVERVDNMEF